MLLNSAATEVWLDILEKLIHLFALNERLKSLNSLTTCAQLVESFMKRFGLVTKASEARDNCKEVEVFDPLEEMWLAALDQLQ